MNILISSAGRRGALVRLVMHEAARYGGRVFAVDAGELSSACRLAHCCSRVPRCTSPEFVPSMLDFCRRHDIRLIIPTIDTELPVYAAHRSEFELAGTGVAVSAPETVAICGDKLRTQHFFQAIGLPTVRSFDPERTNWQYIFESRNDAGRKPPYGLVVKPRFGSASQGVHTADDAEELAFFLERTEHPIVQERAVGEEFTVNFFTNRDGGCVSAVPHRRIETRDGEVMQAITARHRELIRIAHQLAASLPGAWGPMCLQAFAMEEGTVRLIELNARFGGGYPLAYAAGVNFIRWLIHDRLDKPLPKSWNEWQDGLIMSRWDDAVFWRTSQAEPIAA